MIKLKATYYLILTIKGIFCLSSLLAIVYISLAPMNDNNYVNYDKFTYSLNDPYFKVSSDELQYLLHSALPSQENIVLTVGKVDFAIPIDPEYKIITLSIIILFSAIILMLLHTLQKIVRSITLGNAFSLENIRRLKIIGMLVAISPIIEYVIESISFWWVKSTYTLPGLTVESDTKLGFFTFLIGLVIYTVAIAFENGLKLQEEQELTI